MGVSKKPRKVSRITKLYKEGNIGQARKEFVIAALRKASYRWPARYGALKDSRCAPGLHRCAHCNVAIPSKETKKDHVKPVVSPDIGFISWDIYIHNMFGPPGSIQVLCKPCHSIKTKSENKKRKEARDAKEV